MKIKRQELFKYLEERYGNNYYFGLHGISDMPDIKNAYTDMPKLEKAKNILKTGLINERQLSIKSTCEIFGRLSDTYEKNKRVVLNMNKFTCYRTADEHVVVIVAVPIEFKHSDGRNIFGGWMNPLVYYSDDNSPFECVTDKLFKQRIPKEMILGYYYFNSKDQEAEIILNDGYYDKLSQEQKDIFIEEIFDRNNLAINLNDENFIAEITQKCEDQSEEEFEYINGEMLIRRNRYNVSLINNMIEQSTEFIKEREKSENSNSETIESYTYEEIENMPIEQIDLDKLDPSYEMITSGKYQIREILINKMFDGYKNLAKEVGYYSVNGINENEHVDVETFEEWIRKCKNTPDNLYEIQYQRYYKEIKVEFKNYIQKLKEKSMRNTEIDLNRKIDEYMKLGNEIGLFKNCDPEDVYSKIKGIEIIEDNNITGDALALIINGKNIIKINKKRCESQGKHFLDEVIFHELTHFANEIHQDLYGDRQHKIMAFKNQYSNFSKNNQLIRYPEWGGILLDEAIAQKVAQTMCEKKYGNKIYERRFINSKILDETVCIATDFADYPEYERLANNFSKTIVGKEGLMGLAKLSMSRNALDTIFSKYAEEDDGARKLYKILGYMGNVAIADYASKGHFVLQDSEVNRTKQNVLLSMQKASWIMENELGQNGQNYDD